MDRKRETRLKDFFNHEQPFGPIATPQSASSDILKSLFFDDNLIYEEISTKPSLIIGRKGAGKTAFLRSVYFDSESDIIIELPTHKAFRDIISSIQGLGSGTVFVEETSDLWDIIFWHTILVEISKADDPSENLSIIKKYVSGAGLDNVANPYVVMKRIIKVIQGHGGDSPLSLIADFVDEFAFNNISFAKARDSALNWLDINRKKSIILLDSLEDFHLDDPKMCHAVSGLLRCQGAFHNPGYSCEIRCCIPSEIFHRLKELSANPNKDFQHQLLVHWHAGELIRLAACRYVKYLNLYYPDRGTEFSHLDLTKRSDAVSFWVNILPNKIENRVGIIESPLAYILRHTQLTPRHLLMILNSISHKNKRGNGHPLNFSSNAIIDGIYEQEDTIVKEIFSAFKYVYPDAKQGCERILPELKMRFSDGALHKAFNTAGGKTLTGIFDYYDFKKMMIEIGAVGRVIGETNRYVIGRFEYTVPHRLITSSDDELCVHPVFTEVFSVKKPMGEDKKVIYPYGTDIEQEEFRELR